MHASFGAQQAERVFTVDLDRCALDAGRVAGSFVLNGGRETLAFGIPQVLAHQHAGPVAGFGASGAGLNVDETIQRVGRIVEHPQEFEFLDFRLQLGGIAFDLQQAVFVAFVLAHFKQLGVVCQLGGEPAQRHHDVVERFFLAPEFLCLFRVVPDRRVFQRGVDRPQAFGFGIVVKDTPVTTAPFRPGLRFGFRCGWSVLRPWCVSWLRRSRSTGHFLMSA